MFDAGTVLASNEPFKISDTSKVTINVSVSEEIINSITTGQTVSVTIPAVSSIAKIGTIKTINPAANAGGTYDVEIEIDNADGKLKSGMFGEVSFVKDQSEKTIVLPVDSVITKGGEKYVFVLKDNTAVKTPVQTRHRKRKRSRNYKRSYRKYGCSKLKVKHTLKTETI